MLGQPTTWMNAQRPETRVKERRSNLPPAVEWRLDGTPPPSRVRPMKKRLTTEPPSRRSKPHTGSAPKMKRLKTREGRDESRLEKESRLGREEPEKPINEPGNNPEGAAVAFEKKRDAETKAG
ncbi:BnaCnng22240D [Brassica napus]|uniref:BnaCnng22240D protein n=1 Tax=Brassica napus TaxID=3708 RepID=A0A078IR72_BRANA|nr:BnaCnng22240D [Brassica napus]